MDINKSLMESISTFETEIGEGYAIFEFPNEHNLGKFIKETKRYLIYGFTCYHVLSERYFYLSYIECDLTPLLNISNNVELHVRMYGKMDDITNENNIADGINEGEITTQFITESIIIGFAAARLDIRNELHSDLVVKKIMIGNFMIPIDFNKQPLPNGFDIDETFIINNN